MAASGRRSEYLVDKSPRTSLRGYCVNFVYVDFFLRFEISSSKITHTYADFTYSNKKERPNSKSQKYVTPHQNHSRDRCEENE